MTNDSRLTPKEKEYLRTQRGAYAVILGYLKAERGKIPLPVFNKLTASLGYAKLKRAEIVTFTRELQSEEGDEVLKSLFEKAFARQIKLDDVPNHVEESGKIPEHEVFDQVTDYLIDKETSNAKLRELRKLQREGVYMKSLMENLKKDLTEELKGMPRAKYLTTPTVKAKKGDRSLILMYSDWHVGALVYNEETGGYNFEKLQTSIQSINNKVMSLINELNIKHLYIFFLGDAIEHIYMRNVNQAFESEFTASKQITKATRLIIDSLLTLSKSELPITFGIVSGNHDRIAGDKGSKVYNDNVAYIILDTIVMLKKQFGQLPNVNIIDNREDTYEFIAKVAGKTIKVKHGDFEKKKDEVKIPAHIKDEPIDYYLNGHLHFNRMTQEDYARFHVYASSPMGGNNYAKELNLPTTQGSQTVMILTEGSDTPWFIPLMLGKNGEVS